MNSPSVRPAAVPTTRSDGQFQAVFYGILIVAALLYAGRIAETRTGSYNDDAVYVIAARDLWSHSVGRLFPQLTPDYPLPGLPLLLSPWTRLVEPHWTALEWLSLIATVLSVYWLGLWGRRWMTPTETLAAMMFYAFNPVVARFSGILMPAPFFSATVLGSFLLLRKALEAPSRRRVMALGLALGWGSLMRPEGIVLLLCAVAVLWRSPKRVSFLHHLALPFLFWAAVLLAWWNRHWSATTEFGGDLCALWTYWRHDALNGFQFFGQLLHVFIVNVLLAMRLPPTADYAFAGTCIAFLGLACMGVGFRRLWKEHPGAHGELAGAAGFCVTYLLVHVFWHVAERRYGIPLLPFASVFLICGFTATLQRWTHRRWLGMAAAAMVLTLYTVENSRAVYRSLWDRDPMEAPPWRSLKWIREQTPESARMLSIIAPEIVLYADRLALATVKTPNYDAFLYAVVRTGMGYVVLRDVETVTPKAGGVGNSNVNWNRIRTWLQRDPARFSLMFSDPYEKVAVYRVAVEPTFAAGYQAYVRALQYYRNAQLAKATAAVEAALALDPRLGSALNLRGVLRLHNGDPQQAEKSFLMAIEIQPDSAVAMMNLAALYHQAGRHDLAARYMERGLGVSTLNGNSAVYLRNMKSLQKRWTQDRGMLFVDGPS